MSVAVAQAPMLQQQSLRTRHAAGVSLAQHASVLLKHTALAYGEVQHQTDATSSCVTPLCVTAHRFPLGHYLKTLGNTGDKSIETQVSHQTAYTYLNSSAWHNSVQHDCAYDMCYA
jgi:hypothetical protein